MSSALARKSQLYFISSFAVMIIAGALLFKLPFIRCCGETLEWEDAFFQATSAVCITGLSSIEIGDLNLPGQLLLLLLVHLGGLGIMTLSGSILAMLGRNMNVKDTMIMAVINDDFSPRKVENLLATIMKFVLLMEGGGLVILFLAFWLGGPCDGRELSWYEAAYCSVFFTVSSFFHAGFSIFSDSLCHVNIFVKLGVCALVIAGSLGWYVFFDLIHFREDNRALRIHSKLVLIMTMILIPAGTLGVMLSEWHNGDFTWMDAFFQSVSSRSAGYCTYPTEQLSPNSLTITIILMFIGAAPGSTGGGIKVVAVALALLAIINTIKGNGTVLLFRREIPMRLVMKSFTIITMFIVLTLFGTMLLAPQLPESASASHVYFEAVSAMSTVGLSTGVSGDVNVIGKLVLIILMFIGRIGPFTMLLFLFGREKKSVLRYPEERVVIG